jgi:glycosyltransferase involved in cell wall biosynthesis
VHNSDINLCNGAKHYREEIVDGVKYVFVTCHGYKGNGIRRILNMLEFARKLPGVVKNYEKPDAVLACSMTLQACEQGIKLARKYGAKAVAQIMDLWPENLVAFNIVKASNPIVYLLRRLEKRIYTKCDALIFTAEGAYDYIKEHHWESAVSREKFYYINNGIDLKQFDYNREHFAISDEDLNNSEIFKVVYAGSIRHVNDLGRVLDVAKVVKNERIRFLIWGAGDELEYLKKRVEEEKINNVIFKGVVEKKYVPYITSMADLNFAHNNPSPVFRYGISFNKIFDYMAAGKPILCDFKCKYNPVVLLGAGVSVESADISEIAETIDKFCCMGDDEISMYSLKARKAAADFDFDVLTDKLLEALN